MAWSKKSGHWKWESDTSDREAVEDLHQGKPAPESGDCWGHWVYEKAHRTLRFAPAERGHNYAIPVDDIETAEQLVVWLAHLMEKAWMSPADFGDFLEAVDHLRSSGSGLMSLAYPTK